ncbi:MAG: ABC transporter ATP-binding protein [Acidimicrobiia bacterium]
MTVRLGDTLALDGVSLDVGDGELLAVVGPSGSGKTTLLRTIAGLDAPASGSVLIGGVDATKQRTQDRDIAMVFQDGALLPFLTAGENVGFPLRLRDIARPEIEERVTAEGRALGLEEVLGRLPRELAAGHRQLVQVARAMIRVPSVFLLDEPLARVDAGTRVRLRRDIRVLQQGYGVTTLLATNDPTDAMAIADRLCMIDRGSIQQIGAPLEVYRYPTTTFVAELLGDRPMNLLPVRVRRDAVGSWLVGVGFRLRAWSPELSGHIGRRLTMGVRAEDLVVEDTGEIRAEVRRSVSFGSHVDTELAVGQATLWLRGSGEALERGLEVTLRAVRWHLFGEDGRAIHHAG